MKFFIPSPVPNEFYVNNDILPQDSALGPFLLKQSEHVLVLLLQLY